MYREFIACECNFSYEIGHIKSGNVSEKVEYYAMVLWDYWNFPFLALPSPLYGKIMNFCSSTLLCLLQYAILHFQQFFWIIVLGRLQGMSHQRCDYGSACFPDKHFCGKRYSTLQCHLPWHHGLFSKTPPFVMLFRVLFDFLGLWQPCYIFAPRQVDSPSGHQLPLCWWKVDWLWRLSSHQTFVHCHTLFFQLIK